MKLFPVYQLNLIEVRDAGIPNSERIVFRPMETVNLAEFIVCLGIRSKDGRIMPAANYMYFFGDIEISPPAWVFLYTGTGEDYRQGIVGKDGSIFYVFHWGFDITYFDHPVIVPVLFHIDSMSTVNIENQFNINLLQGKSIENDPG